MSLLEMLSMSQLLVPNYRSTRGDPNLTFVARELHIATALEPSLNFWIEGQALASFLGSSFGVSGDVYFEIQIYPDLLTGLSPHWILVAATLSPSPDWTSVKPGRRNHAVNPYTPWWRLPIAASICMTATALNCRTG